MKTFHEFMSLCEEVEDKSKGLGFAATIKTAKAGGRIGAERKKSAPERRRVKAVGGGKTEPAKEYKPRSDIGSQRQASTRVQQPTQERGSADVKAKAAAAAKEERKKAALARIAAKKAGKKPEASQPTKKDAEKQASKLLSTKKPEEPKPAAKPRRKWQHPEGGGMTRQERDQARNKEKTAAAQKTKKSATEILAQMRKEYEEGGGKWSNAVAVRMRAKAKAAAAS
jgi:hypothetical protein